MKTNILNIRHCNKTKSSLTTANLNNQNSARMNQVLEQGELRVFRKVASCHRLKGVPPIKLARNKMKILLHSRPRAQPTLTGKDSPNQYQGDFEGVNLAQALPTIRSPKSKPKLVLGLIQLSIRSTWRRKFPTSMNI